METINKPKEPMKRFAVIFISACVILLLAFTILLTMSAPQVVRSKAIQDSIDAKISYDIAVRLGDYWKDGKK